LPSLGECTINGSEETVAKVAIKGSHSVPLKWSGYWDSCRDIEVDERECVFRVYEAGVHDAPHVFFIHGGGYTALTWSLVASKLKQRFRLTAVDLRGHGATSSNDDSDLSAETLTADVIALWEKIKTEDADQKRPVVLAGHSMGAAIAVRAAATKRIAALEGIMVIDVVEGTALASLAYMRTVINKRPRSFESLEHAVKWALSTKMCRNEEAACVSIPSMLVESDGRWTWRTPLLQSEPHWQGWYQGLSQLFLGLSAPKLLCLAGTDRLDRTLTVGQMQGKFQLSLIPAAGHAIHEDDADRIAEILNQFIDKFRIGQSPLPFLNKQ